MSQERTETEARPPASRRRAALAVTGAGGINTALLAVQSLWLIPAYLVRLGPRVYGAWLASGELLAWIPYTDLGIPNLVLQRIGVAAAANDTEREARLFASALAVCAAIAGLVGAVGVGLSPFIPGWFGVSGNEASRLSAAFAVGAVSTTVVVVFTTVYAYARAVQRTGMLSGASVLGTFAGLVTAAWLVMRGYGLAAIAGGFAARAVILATGMGIFWITSVPREVKTAMRVDGSVVGELFRAAPVTAGAGFAYAVMNQSEVFAISLILGTEIAAVYAINRKALDLIRSLADSVTWGTYGSFAHLVVSAGRARSSEVYVQIIAIRTTIAGAAAVAFIALNESFVGAWVGAGYYAGDILTLALAAQVIISGGSFTVNYLYRAAGDVIGGSRYLIAESLVRAVAMAALVWATGMSGPALAGVGTATISGIWTHRRLRAQLGAFSPPARMIPAGYVLAMMSLLVMAVLAAAFPPTPSWGFVLGWGTVIVCLSGAVLCLAHPALRVLATPLRRTKGAGR